MSTQAERLIEAREEKGWTKADLRRKAGIKSPSTIGEIESGLRTNSPQLPAIAAALGVEVLWLQHGRGEKYPVAKDKQLVEPGDNRLPIRRALFKLSAGVCGYTIEYENGESEPIFMGKRWFDQHHYKADKLIAVKVNGRSMEPSLYDGDLVVINTEDVALKDGEVFAANYEGELVIKRLKRDAGNWYLASDNPDKVRFADKLCSDGCGLIGKIVYKQSEHI